MPFLDQQTCEDILFKLTGFLKDLPPSENWVRGAVTWTKTTLAIFQL